MAKPILQPLRATSLLLATLLVAGAAVPTASSASAADRDPIVIDGIFTDWKGIPKAASGPWKIAMAEGPRFLYLHFRQTAERILQSNESDLILLLDTDGKASTGRQVFGIGADIEWDFSRRTGKVWKNGNFTIASPSTIGLAILPTVGSRQIEIAIALPNGKGGIPALDKTVRGAFTTQLGNLGLDEEHQSFEYTVGDAVVPEPDPIETDRDESVLRVINYNIERDGLFEPKRQKPYQRIFRALDPDIVGFQEILQFPVQAAGDRLDNWVPLDGGARWQVAAADDDAAIASRFPIDGIWLITPGVDAYLVDTRSRIGNKSMVIVVSLKCCEDVDGLRKVQIDAILSFWRDAMSAGGSVTVPEGTPMLMIGDMNLVGDPREVDALREGIPFVDGSRFAPDWDGGPLLDLRPLHTDQPMAYTWRRDGNTGGFAPGRLDYIFLTSSVLEVVRGFTLHSSSMSNKRRRALKLKRWDTRDASDHLPIVVDVVARDD